MSARNSAWWGLALAVLLAPGLLLGGLVAAVMTGSSLVSAMVCATSGISMPLPQDGDASHAAAAAPPLDPAAAASLTASTVIDGEPVEFAGVQLTNAAHILAAGIGLGLDTRDQVIGVMTAIGESTLHVLDHGDAPGPDSRGLFQQRGNGAWGSYADRMDPHTSASNFFAALLEVAERSALTPSEAAHRVQGNADPNHYEKYWEAAVAVSETVLGTRTGLSGSPAAAATEQVARGSAACGSGSAPAGAAVSATAVSPSGWAPPGEGGLTDAFGNRFHPTALEWRMHNGIDLAAGGCGGQIWAAQAGTVVEAAPDSAGNGTIRIDHGAGLVTKYLHMEADGYLVEVGAVVAAGQQIAITGTSGQSTGCHLHFEVVVDGSRVDPVPFLSARGVTF
ncbi:M23 family metallopeptidase [Pseudoclavibacter helvolus]|uniref:M23 family metallopeptidase n=1 Tax=Pseudoclavibacter helvolus TaxID=255205 RepID=UPI003C713520